MISIKIVNIGDVKKIEDMLELFIQDGDAKITVAGDTIEIDSSTYDKEIKQILSDGGFNVGEVEAKKIQQGKFVGSLLKASRTANLLETSSELEKIMETASMNEDELKKWKGEGFDEDEANDWKNKNIKLDDAKKWKDSGEVSYSAREWIDAGFDINKKNKWKKAGFDLDAAQGWIEVGFEPNKADDWKDEGFFNNKKGAKEWDNENFSSKDARKWVVKDFEPKDAAKWRDAGFDVRTSVAWSKLNATPSIAKDWKSFGFSVKECEDWTQYKFAPDDAKKWKDAGIGPSKAFELKKQGKTPETASKETAPMGEYKDFADCVSKNKDKEDPEAYCGSIKQKVEGGKENAISEDFMKEMYKLEWKDKSFDEVKTELDRISKISLTEPIQTTQPALYIKFITLGDLLKEKINATKISDDWEYAGKVHGKDYYVGIKKVAEVKNEIAKIFDSRGNLLYEGTIKKTGIFM